MALLRSTRSRGSPTGLEARAWLRSVWRPGPERWVWPTSAIAWGVLVAIWFPGLVSGELFHPAAGHGHGAPAGDALASGSGFPAIGHDGALMHIALWNVMLAATMLPTIAPNLRAVGGLSPRARRRLATVEVAAGWWLVWLGVGIAFAILLALVDAAGARFASAVVCLVTAVVWQAMPLRRRAVARCHRSFAPPLTSAAGAACVRFGAALGRDGLLACGPSMLLTSIGDHAPWIVVPLAWLAWRELRRPHDRAGDLGGVSVLLAVGALAVATQF